jgi:FtsP/CotA-like multicopper oxidase with cupredoxin domain
MRRWIRRLLLAGAAVVAVPAAIIAVLYVRADTSTVGRLAFERELQIPPLLEPGPGGVIELDMREGTSELVAGRRTRTWGFNGAHLGPTLRASRGDVVSPRVTSSLPDVSTVHWHGMHLPAEADGGPHQTIEPGETWAPRWTIDQAAATLWYHPHPHGDTDEQVYRGLAGMFIVDDPVAGRLPLPRRYGVDDIPLIVQDKRFEGDGELSLSSGAISPIGRLGDTIVVNGTADPHLDVTTTAVRLRLLNASSARSYDFGFADGRAFELIATDGGLLGAPERLERIQLSPGERAEVVVGFRPGERAVLRSFEPDLGGTDFFNARFAGGDDTFDILELRAAEELDESPPLPARLVAQEAPDVARARVRRFELSGSSSINGRELDMARIDQTVPVDTPEVWEVENRAGIPHNFHVHDTRFQLLEYGGESPPPELRGPKDTVAIPPDTTVRLAVRFADYTDSHMPYMFHCHLLQHEDRGMMGQFVVTRGR